MIVGSLIWTASIDTRGLKRDAKKTEGILARLQKSISSIPIGAVAAIGGGVAAFSSAIREIVKVNAEFEQAMSDLSALTGLTGDNLKYLEEQAKRLGATTTQTASQVANAMKLIGSQRPELLADAEALTKVTEASITLAEASGLDVPTASRALTQALNMYQAPASKTGEFIDILATAARKGAGDIAYLSAAVEKVGGVAKSSNLTFQELSAAIETLAPAISEPTTAGIQLRNVLLRLQRAGLGMSSGTFNFTEALQEAKVMLEGIQDPAERAQAMLHLFGIENTVAAQQLMENVDSMNQLAASLNKTGAAAKMAQTRTDNLKGAWNRFKSALEGLILDMNSDGGLTGALTKVIQFLTELINNFGYIKEALRPVLQVIGELFRSLDTLAQSLGLTTEKTSVAQGIMQGLGNVLKVITIDIKIMVSILTALINALAQTIQKIREWINSHQAVKQVIDTVTQAIRNFITNIGTYLQKIAKFLGIDWSIDVNIDESKAKAQVEGAQKQMQLFADEKPVQVPVIVDTEEAKKQMFELERMKIETMQDGMEKELALIDLEMRQKADEYEKAGLKEYIPALEKLYGAKKQAVIEKCQKQELEKQWEYQRLLIDAMQAGLEKRLALIDLEYQKRIEAAKKAGIDVSNIEKEWQDKRLQETKQYYENLANTKLEALKKEQQVELLRAQLAGESEKQITILKKQQEIERLQTVLATNQKLTDIEKQYYALRIQQLQKEIEYYKKHNQTIESLLSSVGEAIAQNADWAAESEEDFARSVYNATRVAVAAWIQQAVASVVAKTLSEVAPPLNLIMAPIAGAAAKALFLRLLPELKPPKFAEGGVVGGNTPYADAQWVLAKSNEVILNQKQQANLLYALSKQRIEVIETSKRIAELEASIRQVKNAIENQKVAVYDGQRIIILDSQNARTQKVII